MDFGYINQGKLFSDEEGLYPATASGTIYLLKKYIGNLKKDILIINRSILVGKPLACMLLNYDATVTIAHSKTSNIKEKILNNDIIIFAIGKKEYIKKEDFTKEELEILKNKIIIDIGVTKENRKNISEMCQMI